MVAPGRRLLNLPAAALAAIVILACCPLAAHAQTPAAEAPVPSPAPTAAPNPIGPAFGPNDPCTSLAALVSRPSVTSSVCTVRPNHVLIETGYLNTTFTGGGNAVTYPTASVRIGTRIPALEIDFAPPSAVRTNAGGLTTATTDVGAGLKYVFGYTPRFSWGGQAFFTAPTGLNGGSANGTTAAYALNASYALGPVFSLATTLSTSSLTNGAQRWNSFVPSLVLGASLPNTTGVFAELVTFSNANGLGTPTRAQYMFGMYRDLGPRFQLDASTAFSPTTQTGKYTSFGLGASYYF